MHEHDEDDYRGPATLVADDREIPVEVVLRGHFQPIDGRFHWYGRLSASDPWGRYRITGTGKPPFAVPQELPEE